MSRSVWKFAAAAMATVLFSGTALAQEASTQDEIVVTGSRIRTSPLQNTQPIIAITSEDIAKTGLTSTADLLQRLPIAGGGLNTRFNNSGNFGNPPDGGGVGAGAAEIDLRFLGSRRALVLVDGLRWVNGASASGVPGSIDLNTIPSSMIERIEVQIGEKLAGEVADRQAPGPLQRREQAVVGCRRRRGRRGGARQHRHGAPPAGQ